MSDGVGSPVVGYVPGAWDMFHIGHLNILTRARAHCDILIAGDRIRYDLGMVRLSATSAFGRLLFTAGGTYSSFNYLPVRLGGVSVTQDYRDRDEATALLRADYVVGQVEPEPRRREPRLQGPPERGVGAGEGQRRWQPPGDLTGEPRTGQRRKRPARQHGRGDLGLAAEAAGVDALGAEHERDRRQPGAALGEEGLGLLGGHHEQDRRCIGEDGEVAGND